MAQDEHEILELLKCELKFLEDGGYGRSPRTPWRPTFVFEDSPTCPNLGDPARPHPCSECLLMKFVPDESQEETFPCRFIPLNEAGQTVDYFYRCGTQPEMEEALDGWLRRQITRIEQQLATSATPWPEERAEFSKLA
jgi:hypothetical protein